MAAASELADSVQNLKISFETNHPLHEFHQPSPYYPYYNTGYHLPYPPNVFHNYPSAWIFKRDHAPPPSKAKPTNECDGFHVTMDVIHFGPEEISVKIIGNKIVVEGRHEEKEDDHGEISRHFIRKYKIPKCYDVSQASTMLSSDGVLSIQIPYPHLNEPERVIPIQKSDKPFNPEEKHF